MRGLVAATLLLAACAPAAAPVNPTAAPAATPKPAPTLAAKAEVPDRPAASPVAKIEAKPAASPSARPAFDEKAVADFYRGKTIKILVGHGAGGGFDVYARMVARHLPKYIPGARAIIVENVPAAGGLVAANQLYNVEPKDGTVIGHIIGGFVRSQLLGGEGVQFDAAKFQYLGAPIGENSILMVTKASGIANFERLLEQAAKPVTLADSGTATTNHNAALLTKAVLGANVNIVSGYTGTAKIELAMDQGEVDGQYNDWASSKSRTLDKFTSGDWLIIGQMTAKPLADLPQKNVPLVQEFAKTDEQKQMLQYGLITPNQFARPFFVAPGVPSDRVAALEQAFAATMADKDFQADAEKAKLALAPLRGPQLQELIITYLAMPADLKKKLAEVLPQT